MCKRIVTLILCLSMKLFAQHVHPSPEFGVTMTANTSIPTNTYTPVSHMPYVTGSGTYSGFNVIPGGSYPVTQIAPSADGQLTLALSNTPAQGTVYKFDPTASQPFVAQPQYGTGMQRLTIGSSGSSNGNTNIWAVSNTQGTCGSGDALIYQFYNGAWPSNSAGCETYLTASATGGPFGLGNVWAISEARGDVEQWWTSGGAYWIPMATVPGNGSLSALAVTPDGNRLAAVRGGQIYLNTWNGSAWGGWGSLGSNIGTTQVAFGYDPFQGELLYAAHPKSGSQIQIEVYANNQWNAFNNDATYSILAAGGSGTFSTNSAGTMTRYSPTAISWTHSFQVNTTCNPSPCPSTVHTYTSTLTALGRQSVTKATAPANTTPTVNSDMLIDPFGDPGPDDGSSDVGNCPVVGALFNVLYSFASNPPEACQATYENINEDICVDAELIGYECTYTVAPYCTPATTPPDLLVSKVYNNWQLTKLPQPWGFFLEGFCWRPMKNGLPDGPWIGIAGFEGSLTWNTGRGTCTHHP